MKCTVIKTETSVNLENPSYIGYGLSFKITSGGNNKLTLNKCHVKLVGTDQPCVVDTDSTDLGTEFDIGGVTRVRFPAVDALVLITSDTATRIGSASSDDMRYTTDFKVRYCPDIVNFEPLRRGAYNPQSFGMEFDFKKFLGENVESIWCNMYDGVNTFMNGRFEPDDFASLKTINIQKLLKRECIFGDINGFPSSVKSLEFWTTNLSGSIETLGDKTNLETLMVYDSPLVTGTIEGMCEDFLANGKTSGTIKVVLQQTSATLNNSVPVNDLFAIFGVNSVTIKKNSSSGETVATYDGVSWNYP